MNIHQIAQDLHDLWECAHGIHLQLSELLATRPIRDPYRRLALEMALHDVMALAARAEALANFAETSTSRRRKHPSG